MRRGSRSVGKRNTLTAARGKRTFSLRWGSGIIDEQAQASSRYHRPTIQLLRFLEGEAAGARQLRFCYYDHYGRFQRSPLIIDEADIPALRAALSHTPRLRRLLQRLLE
jgi:hypothetical protein